MRGGQSGGGGGGHKTYENQAKVGSLLTQINRSGNIDETSTT